MKKFLIIISALLLAFGMSGTSQAEIITSISMYGDADGFGIGAVSGAEFDWTSVGAGDGDGTDVWRSGSQTWSHNFPLPVCCHSITSASIEIFHGGDGYPDRVSDLYVDGLLVGTLKDADGADGSRPYVTYNNFAEVDIFNLTGFIAALSDGSIQVELQTSTGDGWALDYSRLTVDIAIPEPATLLLLGSGLVGLGGMAWRIRKR